MSDFWDGDTIQVGLASATGLSTWYIEQIDVWLKCGISFFSLVFILIKLYQLINNKGKQ